MSKLGVLHLNVWDCRCVSNLFCWCVFPHTTDSRDYFCVVVHGLADIGSLYVCVEGVDGRLEGFENLLVYQLLSVECSV